MQKSRTLYFPIPGEKGIARKNIDYMKDILHVFEEGVLGSMKSNLATNQNGTSVLKAGTSVLKLFLSGGGHIIHLK